MHGFDELVRKQVLDTIEQGDLLDPTVFRLDLSKVQGMKLTGWKDVVGTEMVLDMERKGTNAVCMPGMDVHTRTPRRVRSPSAIGPRIRT